MERNARIHFGGDVDFPTHMCYGKFVLERIIKHKDKIALINALTGNQISYGDMSQQVIKIATSLIQLGLKSGDVVAISSENRFEFLVTAIAVFCTEAVVTFINPSYSKDELVHTLGISEPKYMFLSGDMYEKNYDFIKKYSVLEKVVLFDNIPSDTGIILFKDLIENSDVAKFQTPDFKGKMHTCLILYSSGTTGQMKGVKLSHSNLIAAGIQPLFTTSPKINLTIAPWSSCMGMVCTMDEIVDGRTVVFLPRFNEQLYMQIIEKYKIGILAVPPPTLVTLCKSRIAQQYDISSVELIYCGGAPLNPGIIKQLKYRYPNIKHVLQGFGMSEATGAVTKEFDHSPREGSVGNVVTGNIVKVVDVETKKLLGPGESGEVCIKGPVLFQGYVGKSLSEELDSEGFYKTGDIAYYDEDGYFFIVDRIKELIKYKAWQVAPSEIEALLLQHPAVKDAGVIGAPDTLAGELPTAFVVKQTNAQATEKEIIDFVASKVSPWKRLTGGVIFLDEIPKTPSGKILRRKLKEMLPKIPKSVL